MKKETVLWDESDSQTFIDYGRYFIPQREAQIQTIGDLIPAQGGPFHILELACGEGVLAESLLSRFPQATLHGYDISAEMLKAASERLAAFANRFQPNYFELADLDWRKAKRQFHAVVSSLTIHHLDGPDKLRLFMDVYEMLSAGGVFVVADLVQTTRPEGTAVSAKAWDDAVQQRAIAFDNNLEVFEAFQKLEWNLYRHPDEMDKPSTLFDQLKWMEQAEFTAVDVHWMLAGHVIFSGMKR